MVVEPWAQYWNQKVHGLVVVSPVHRVRACRLALVAVMSVGRVARPSHAATISPTAISTAAVRAVLFIIIDTSSYPHARPPSSTDGRRGRTERRVRDPWPARTGRTLRSRPVRR